MVEVLDLQVRIDPVDQAREGHALSVQREVGHGLEGGFQGGETLQGGLRPRELLTVESDGAVVAIDRRQRPVEVAVPDGVVGALLAHQRQFVQRLA
jgi:hypothetical protein